MMLLNLINIAYAHEEGATSITLDNALGPFLALIIIILAIVVAKRIKKIKNHYTNKI